MNQRSLFIKDGHHQLHLRHIWNKPDGVPVLMLHGTIENGKIFYTESGKGLACYLAEQGFDVYVADFRGKGKSTPHIHQDSEHGQFEAITQDIPLFIEEVAKRNPKKMHVICHSWGGVLFASTLVRYPEKLTYIASNICFGTKRSVLTSGIEKTLKVDWLWNRIAPKIAKRKGYIDAKKLKFGAESETSLFLQDSIDWVKPNAWLDRNDGFNYQEAAKEIQWPPTWHITGIRDKVLGNVKDVQAFIDESNNTTAKLSLLSKQSGNALDYDHIDILTHPSNIEDHFPHVVHWLNEQHS
ncbi:alpha/beta fold hydrolase [Thalassotalea profundi]|uniref:Alpha/beta hydrolase n=1 Tax=Thalassotalea profundi TaxID=2036687 RepID=A0ABQ3IKR1_9GAMM|nr:alpha/beta hydrolase [Thalassotalea profundi]GHE84851.1 alpha/beta hydrolase [Thalassotalea profundi]